MGCLRTLVTEIQSSYDLSERAGSVGRDHRSGLVSTRELFDPEEDRNEKNPLSNAAEAATRVRLRNPLLATSVAADRSAR